MAQNGVYGSARGELPDADVGVDQLLRRRRGQYPSTTAPPTVTAQSPATPPAASALATKVQATFSRAWMLTTLTASSFTLKRPDGSTVVGVRRLRRRPRRPATLTPSARSRTRRRTRPARHGDQGGGRNGSRLPGRWTFTTRGVAAAPTVAATVPTASGDGVARDTTVKAMFSRSMDPSTLTSSSFTLTPSGGAAVAATVSYDDATKTATLTPSRRCSFRQRRTRPVSRRR